jgi:hypothetical protein
MTTTSTTPAVSTPLSRDQAGGLLGQTMGLVALTAGCFALGAYIRRDTSGAWTILWYIVAFAVLFGMNAAAQRSEQLAVGLLVAFGVLLGLAVAPTVGYYVGAEGQGHDQWLRRVRPIAVSRRVNASSQLVMGGPAT